MDIAASTHGFLRRTCNHNHNFRKFRSSVTLTLILDRVKVISACTIPVGLPGAQPSDCSFTHYRNMAIWISWNIDIPRSLNSHDSFPRRKFEKRAPTSCRTDPMLSLPTISFELYARMAEEIDLEKCSFRNFTSSVTLTLTLDRVEIILVEVYPHTKLDRNRKKLFWTYVRTDGQTDVCIGYGHTGYERSRVRLVYIGYE